MNGHSQTRRLKGGFVAMLLMLLIGLPKHFYSAFDEDRFTGWSSYLGSRWFSEMADRMELSYGCAPSATLQNIYGFAFCYAVFALLVCAGAIFLAGRESNISLRIITPCIAASALLSGALVYFDTIFSVFRPPFICRTTSFDVSEAALSDSIVRHLCDQISMLLLAPIIVLAFGMLLYRWLGGSKPATS